MKDASSSGNPGNAPFQVSFEFFPPKSPAQAEVLEHTARRLASLNPSFVSVTYGAGGTSRERSLSAAARIVDEIGVEVAAHLTCVGASRAELAVTIEAYRAAGIRRFVALRGDPPGGLGETYRPHPEGYQDTAELVAALKRSGARDVAVSAYPERHPHSCDWDTEIATLKRKVDAGADRAITQFFFDARHYEAYVERVRRAGIAIPIVPGIMPILRFASVRQFAARCGALVPAWLTRRFEGLEEDSAASRAAAVSVAAEQVSALAQLGVQDFHFYTMNRAELCEAVLLDCEGGITRRAAA